MAKYPSFDLMTDERDGRTYRTVKIGSQVWMAENLAFTIDNAIGCYYNNDEKYKKYGRLYDWVEALTIAPEGWHLPTKEDWETMTSFIGGARIEGKKLKAASGWNSNGSGTDEYGFSALPGGLGYSDGSFYYVGSYGFWWSASELDSDYAYSRNMYYNLESALWGSLNKGYLFSVRCVKD